MPVVAGEKHGGVQGQIYFWGAVSRGDPHLMVPVSSVERDAGPLARSEETGGDAGLGERRVGVKRVLARIKRKAYRTLRFLDGLRSEIMNFCKLTF